MSEVFISRLSDAEAMKQHMRLTALDKSTLHHKLRHSSNTRLQRREQKRLAAHAIELYLRLETLARENYRHDKWLEDLSTSQAREAAQGRPLEKRLYLRN